MQVGSLVEYIGGQDEAAKFMLSRDGLPQLQKNYPYLIIGMGELDIGLCVGLQEYGWTPSFLASMFREVQPLMKISIEEILKIETYVF